MQFLFTWLCTMQQVSLDCALNVSECLVSTQCYAMLYVFNQFESALHLQLLLAQVQVFCGHNITFVQCCTVLWMNKKNQSYFSCTNLTLDDKVNAGSYPPSAYLLITRVHCPEENQNTKQITVLYGVPELLIPELNCNLSSL